MRTMMVPGRYLSAFAHFRELIASLSEAARDGDAAMFLLCVLLLCGTVLRIICSTWWDPGASKETTGDLLVGFHFRHEAIIECLFLRTRGLQNSVTACQQDITIWLLPLFGNINVIYDWGTIVHAIVATAMIQLITTLMILQLLKIPVERGDCGGGNGEGGDLLWASKTETFAMLYFLNPITIISCIWSIIPSLLHLIIAMLLYSASKGWTLPVALCLSLLIAGNGAFICILPAALSCLSRTTGPATYQTSETNSDDRTSRYLLVLWTTIVWGSVLVRALLTDGISMRYSQNPDGGIIYRPSSGIFWYLDMEVFPRFRQYFTLLVDIAPYILAVPIAVRLSSAKPMHGLTLSLAVVMYFRRETSFSDVVFMVAVIASLHMETVFNGESVPPAMVNEGLEETTVKGGVSDHTSISGGGSGSTAVAVSDSVVADSSSSNTMTSNSGSHDNSGNNSSNSNSNSTNSSSERRDSNHVSIQGMRLLPLITLGIAVPMVVSECMLGLWTRTGTGNANYLFFQGLVMWVFLALAIIEFTNATIREIND